MPIVVRGVSRVTVKFGWSIDKASVLLVSLYQVCVTGHSRNGKQSLIFAAHDERVAAVVGSSPGAPISSPYVLEY